MFVPWGNVAVRSRNTDRVTPHALSEALVLVFEFLEPTEALIAACDDEVVVTRSSKVRHGCESR